MEFYKTFTELPYSEIWSNIFVQDKMISEDLRERFFVAEGSLERDFGVKSQVLERL